MTCAVCGHGTLWRVRSVAGLFKCSVCGVCSTGSRSATIFDDTYYERYYGTGERARTYDEIAQRMAPFVAPGTRMLDIGCGVGHLVVALRDLGYDAVGVDPSEAARRSAAKHDVDARATMRDVRTGSFGAAFLVDVIAHVADVRALAAEAIDVLAPGGVLVVRTPAATGPLVAAESAATLGGRVGRSPLLHRAGRVHQFDKASLTRAAVLWGLRDVEVETVHESIVRDEAHPFTGAALQRFQRVVTNGGSLVAIGRRP